MNLLAHSINNRILNLLPEDLLSQRLEAQLEDVRKLDGIVKCRCPFHEGSTFPSYQIHLRRHAAFCTVHRCEGSQEIDLIELLARLQGISPQKALLQLLTDAAISLSTQDNWDLDDYITEEVESLVEQDKLNEARELLGLYSAMAPQNQEVQFLNARLNLDENDEQSIEQHVCQVQNEL